MHETLHSKRTHLLNAVDADPEESAMHKGLLLELFALS